MSKVPAGRSCAKGHRRYAVTDNLFIDTRITHIAQASSIFDENNSFDHSFGIYPYAANLAGEPKRRRNPQLIAYNPNKVRRSASTTRMRSLEATTISITVSRRALMDKFLVLNGTGTGCTPNLPWARM
jgi:hypothetical protein